MIDVDCVPPKRIRASGRSSGKSAEMRWNSSSRDSRLNMFTRSKKMATRVGESPRSCGWKMNFLNWSCVVLTTKSMPPSTPMAKLCGISRCAKRSRKTRLILIPTFKVNLGSVLTSTITQPQHTTRNPQPITHNQQPTRKQQHYGEAVTPPDPKGVAWYTIIFTKALTDSRVL